MRIKNLILTALMMVSLSMFAHVDPVKINTEKSTISWVGKKVTGQHSGTIAKGKYKVQADLTIKGKTESISFDANVEKNMATAEITIDRTKFDVKYGSGSFFDDLGDNMIYDDFVLNVNLAF